MAEKTTEAAQRQSQSEGPKTEGEAHGQDRDAQARQSQTAFQAYLKGLDADTRAAEQKDQIVAAFSAGVGGYIQQYPSAVADAYRNGTLSNLNETFKHVFGYGEAVGEGENFERGCVAMQGATMASIAEPLKQADCLWTAQRVVVGGAGFEHHAVALYRKDGGSLQSGSMLDPWIAQTADPQASVFTWGDWVGEFGVLSLLGAPRPE